MSEVQIQQQQQRELQEEEGARCLQRHARGRAGRRRMSEMQIQQRQAVEEEAPDAYPDSEPGQTAVPVPSPMRGVGIGNGIGIGIGGGAGAGAVLSPMSSAILAAEQRLHSALAEDQLFAQAEAIADREASESNKGVGRQNQPQAQP